MLTTAIEDASFDDELAFFGEVDVFYLFFCKYIKALMLKTKTPQKCLLNPPFSAFL